jgi:DNA/RNA endonuclease YhcR with UshA esterase domain
MKKLLFTALVVLAIVKTTTAQQTFSSESFNKKLGKTGTLCDTVYSVRIVADTLTLLNMGGAFPNQKYTVAVKGTKVNLDWANIKGKPLCVTGVFILYKNRPEIVIDLPEQINAKSEKNQR